MKSPFASRAGAVASAVFALLVSACGGSSGAPRADISDEVTGGNGPFIASAAGAVTAAPGYEVHEYLVSGTATSYGALNGVADDGRWTLDALGTAEYRTRIVVRRPSNPEDASGTVIVEWLNVSGGVDADPGYGYLAEEIVRAGHVWVGVSAQLVGVEGGAVLIEIGGLGSQAGLGLKAIDPARYGTLSHPGDGYAFDIFTQVARALRAGGDVLGGMRPRYLIAAGESQSAMALTSYYDGFQKDTNAFDGFFVHSRAGVSLPFVGPGEPAELSGAIFNQEHPIFRTDVTTPVMDLQAEGDVTGLLNSHVARQPDTETFRLWEVAGTAHADAHLLGPATEIIDCGVEINDGPMHVVAKAAFRALDTWVRSGNAPPVAPRIEMVDDPSAPAAIRRDDDGIAFGGVRSPPVDVPVDVLSGAASSSGGLACLLFGSTVPLSSARIAELYTSRADYQQQFEAGTDVIISAGFALEEDRAALAAYAQPLRVDP